MGRVHLKTHNTVQDVEIRKFEGTVLNGYFLPYKKTKKEIAISKVNLTLNIILGILILFSVVSYYFITSSEMKLNELRKETLLLNDENLELQNQLDYLKSYNNVNQTMQSKKIVQKAAEVVEVSAKPEEINVNDKRFFKHDLRNKDVPKHPSSMNWSLGY